MPSSPILQAWRNTVSPSLNEGRQPYTNCNHIFLRLCCPPGAVDIRVRGSILLPDELYRFLAQSDEHQNRNSSLLEQLQDNGRYRCKSECAGGLAGAEPLSVSPKAAWENHRGCSLAQPSGPSRRAMYFACAFIGAYSREMVGWLTP